MSDNKPTEKELLGAKVPCVFCGERLGSLEKRKHACWVKKGK